MSRKSEANGGALGYKNDMNQSSSGRTSVNATSGQILYYNSGTITGSPNMTFDGTTTTISSLFVNTLDVTTISAANLNITGLATMSSAIVNHQLSVSGLNVYSSIINLSSELQNLSSYVYTISTGQWSLYPATQDVNLSGFAINNVTSLSGLSNINGVGVTMDSLGNIFLGLSAGQNDITAGSIGIGGLALQNVCGLFVNGIGAAASISCTGSYVDSMGLQAAAYNSGSNVVAIGTYAANCVSGSLNLDGTLSTGSSVLPGGSFVTALGAFAAYSNISDYVVAIGARSAVGNSGRHVVAIGNANTSGSPLSFAPAAFNTGNNIVAIGQTAGAVNKGSDVIAIGRSAGQNNSGGSCVFLGQSAGSNNSGSNCVFLGQNAGNNNSGSNCVFLGSNVGTNNTTSNRFLVGNSNLLVGDLVTASLGVGTSTLTAKLNVGGTFLTTGLATLNSAQVTNNLSAATLTTTGLATLNSAQVTNNLSAATLTTTGLATLNSARVTNNLSAATLTTTGLATLNSAQVTSNLSAATLTTTGLATLNSAQVTNNLSAATLTTTGLATLNSARVTTSLNVSGLTTLSAAVVQSNLSINTLNGATYPSTLGSTGQVLSVSSTANTLYWASISNIAVNANMGNVARVDQIYGSDTLGAVGTYPFLTISKALSAVTSNQQVLILPGIYNEGPLTIPPNVSVRGATSTVTIIQMSNVSASVDMITMNSNCRLEEVTVTLTTSTTPFNSTYNAIKCINGNSSNIGVRAAVVNVFNYNPSGSAACFMSVGDAASVSNAASTDTFRASTLNMTASGQQTGYSECIRVSGSNRVAIRDTNMFLTGTNCSGATLICVETPSAGVADIRSSTISASGTAITNCSLAEISQTNATSQIVLSYSTIQNHLTNGKGFALDQAPTYLNYSLFGSGTGANTFANKLSNNAYVVLPGNTLITSALSSISDVVPVFIEQDQVLTQASFVANTSVSAAVTALIYSNTTLTNPMFSLTLSGNGSNVTNNSNTFKMLRGQQLVVQISGSSGSYNPALKSLQVNIGQF